ncbi:MAG: transposase family protein [Saprospiraceae bacterium]|nr:transposase family protein [Saprospiraceae bacterium]
MVGSLNAFLPYLVGAAYSTYGEFALFTGALNIRSPWYIKQVTLKDSEYGEDLHISIGHKKGARFYVEGTELPVYDHQQRTWRHLDFIQHRCYLRAAVPRVKTKANRVKLIKVPWAVPGSSFTLFFEFKIMELVLNGMNRSEVGRTLRIDGKRVGRVISSFVSFRRPHNSISSSYIISK